MRTVRLRTTRPAGFDRVHPSPGTPTHLYPPALVESLELLPAPAALLDGAGAARFANGPFTRLLGDEPGRAALQEEIARFVRSLRRGTPGDACEGAALDGRYRLRARWVEGDGRGFALLVALRQAVPEPPSDAALRARYGLTRAEVRVARLLAEGHSNRGIAAALCISPHTSRHHTERVMAKMNAGSRAEVGARLRAHAAPAGDG